MMRPIEVERKRELRDGAREVVEAELAALGYHHAGALTEVDTYYSRPDVDFMETVECLRVRQRDGFAEITYKPASDASTHSRDGVISKRETNVVLRGAEQAADANHLLAAVGMVLLARVEKSRTVYRHPRGASIVVAIDTVTDAGVFVETEVTAAHKDAAAVLVDEIERQLGLTAYPVVNLPYRDLVIRRGNARRPSATYR